ncbi:MAG: extracellular solute-binding protein [Actinobacteria bacterium]|nr:extracellular solute-binding protein [Actinomycetota bacterium]
MRTTPTRLAALTGAVALAAGLTACSGSDDGGGGDGGTADATSLKLWHYESPNGAMGIAWAEAIKVFEEEHPGVTIEFEEKSFEQIQQTAGMILSSDEGPDIMEYNKGNATTGLLSSQGLLTDITAVADERGWTDMLSPSLATTAQYDESGVMGSGNWFGIPNYGEFVTVYYNKAMFEDAGLEVPTSLDEMVEVMDTFVAEGVTPLGMAGAEYPAGQLFYQLTLSQVDRQWITDYQMFTGPVDWQGPELTFGAETFAEWVDAGYVASDSASLKAEDMGVAFINGTYPMMVSGSWWYGRLVDEIDGFEWGVFNFPGNTFNAGSSGNLWVVPTNSKAPELAYDFIDITMRPEIQAILGNNGGLPVAADPADITDAKSQELITAFNEVLENDGLAFYPDWPVPGFYDVIVNSVQKLINGSAEPATVLDELGAAYDQGVANAG